MSTNNVSRKVRHQLWGTSGNTCAFPGCNMRVVEYREDKGVSDVVGDMCHIISEKPDGPRSVTKLTLEQRERWSNLVADLDGFDNLLVMCKGHNKEIDGTPEAWPIETLVRVKKEHLAVHTGPVQIRKGVLGPQFTATDLSAPVRDVLVRIASRDTVVAAELDGMLSNGGVERLHRQLEEGSTWLEKSSWARWEGLGAICQASGRADLALACFVRASNAEGCPEPERELIYAAAAASELGESERCRELVDQAVELNADAPLVALNREVLTTNAAAIRDLAVTLKPTDRRDAESVARMIANAHLALDDFDAARRAVADANAAGHGHRELDRMGLIIELADASGRGQRQERLNAPALRQLSARFIVQADYARAAGHKAEGRLRAHAVEALLLAEELDEAIDLINAQDVMDAASRSADAAFSLAQQALHAHQIERAAEIASLYADTNLNLQTLVAHGKTRSADPAVAAQGEANLERLLECGDADVARNAADLLIVATIHRRDAIWHDRAAEVLRGASAARECILRGVFEHSRGNLDAAERAWMSAGSTPEATRYRLELARKRGDRGKALTLGGQLHAMGGDREHSLRYGHQLVEAERYQEAIVIFLEVARDATAPRDDRALAYSEFLQVAETLRDPSALITGGNEWLEMDPASKRARWSLIYGHVLAGDYRKAFTFVTDDLEASNESMADLLSAVLAQALPANQALPRLEAIAVAADRAYEAVEYRIVMVGLSREADLDADAEQIYARAISEFPDRFPDSRLLQQYSAEGPEAIIELIKEKGRTAEQQQALNEIAAWVEQGRMPIAFLGGMTSQSTIETLLLFGGKPLMYGATDAATQTVEAKRFYGSPVACDATSLAVQAILPDDVAAAVRTAVQGSWITSSTASECVDFAMRSKIGESTMTAGVDRSTGRVWAQTIPPAIVDRLSLAEARIEALKATFTVEADQLPTDIDSFATELLREDQMHKPAVRALASSMLLAQRHGTALYSDDRVARQLARELGIATFGTLGLIMAIVDRGDIPAARGAAVIQELLTTLSDPPLERETQEPHEPEASGEVSADQPDV